jgi:hypothetical protein
LRGFLAFGPEKTHICALSFVKSTYEPVGTLTIDEIFVNGERVIEAAVIAMKHAAKAAVAENDRLGITSYGTVDGKIVEFVPPKTLAP